MFTDEDIRDHVITVLSAGKFQIILVSQYDHGQCQMKSTKESSLKRFSVIFLLLDLVEINNDEKKSQLEKASCSKELCMINSLI